MTGKHKMDVLMISVAVLTLIVSFTMFFNNPSFTDKKVITSPSVSQAFGFSITNTQDDNPVKYYGAQFKIDKSQFKKAPEFTQITGYVNTNPIKLSDLKGKVVLVHFWTYTCINCIHTIPHLNDWYAKYASKGFVIAGVQTPEFEFEKDINSVKEAVKEFKIKYPVIQDNNYGTWNAYGNRYWPRDYLVDSEGYIRYDHVGEGGYDETENKIRSLLAEPGITADNNQTVTNIA
jgi:thiol-disulfide isomerase/thioredoxin